MGHHASGSFKVLFLATSLPRHRSNQSMGHVGHVGDGLEHVELNLT